MSIICIYGISNLLFIKNWRMEKSLTKILRKGQCHEPLVESYVRFFAILHQKLKSFESFFEDIIPFGGCSNPYLF